VPSPGKEMSLEAEAQFSLNIPQITLEAYLLFLQFCDRYHYSFCVEATHNQ
jgi:hypothetical protein